MDTLKKIISRFINEAPPETGCQSNEILEREFTAVIQKAMGQELPQSPAGDLWAKIKAQAEMMPQLPPAKSEVMSEPIYSLPTLTWLPEAIADKAQRPVPHAYHVERRNTRQVQSQHMAAYGQYMRSSMQYLRLNFGVVQGC
ncbi:MAG: hypothetical protein HY862_10800 [Chloroflexi bacterium]|nr:hypothetical protein [Chloroflexota bacterium]